MSSKPPPSNPFEKLLRHEKLAPIDEKPHVAAQQSNDAQPAAFTLAQENAAAFAEWMDHPSLHERDRVCARAYFEASCDEKKAAKEVRCSPQRVLAAVENVKYLMLHPPDSATDLNECVVTDEDIGDEVVIDTPPEVAQSFQDIEDSLASAAKTAHRVIRHFEDAPALTGAEVTVLEKAMRIMVLLRRSESEYLKANGNRAPAADDNQLHAIAGKVKVKR